MDETGWRLRGGRRALWGIFTERHAILQITHSRHDDHAKNLLGASSAIVTSDRRWACNRLPVKRRQICWSQLVEIEFGTKLELRGFDEERGAGGSPAHDEVTGDFRERAIDIARTVYAPGSVRSVERERDGSIEVDIAAPDQRSIVEVELDRQLRVTDIDEEDVGDE